MTSSQATVLDGDRLWRNKLARNTRASKNPRCVRKSEKNKFSKYDTARQTPKCHEPHRAEPMSMTEARSGRLDFQS